MKQFLDQDFMLLNDTAKVLYHDFAEQQPIIDYHCHLSAKEICENKPAKKSHRALAVRRPLQVAGHAQQRHPRGADHRKR